jgi:pilus assembly protein TadC
MTGFRAFSYEFVKTFPVLSKGFDIETEMSIHAAHFGLRVENVVVEYRDRPAGSVSKLNTYKDGARVLKKILSLFVTYRPLSFFGILSILFFALSAAGFAFVSAGSGITACMVLFHFGLLFLLAGFVLQAGADQDRRNFEREFVRIRTEKVLSGGKDEE